MIPGNTSITFSTSSSVLKSLKDRRKDPWANSWGSPIPKSTWDGSKDPDVQAEPDEPQMPSKSKFKRMPSPSMNSKMMLTLLGSL